MKHGVRCVRWPAAFLLTEMQVLYADGDGRMGNLGRDTACPAAVSYPKFFKISRHIKCLDTHIYEALNVGEKKTNYTVW
jgi:hypothetical protein